MHGFRLCLISKFAWVLEGRSAEVNVPNVGIPPMCVYATVIHWP